MPTWTTSDLRAYEDRLARIRAPVTQHDPRVPLVETPPREAAGSEGAPQRACISFVVFCCQPQDWDNTFVKPLQDCLVGAGLLPGDGWQILEGQVRSEKVKSRAEERTEVTITAP